MRGREALYRRNQFRSSTVVLMFIASAFQVKCGFGFLIRSRQLGFFSMSSLNKYPLHSTSSRLLSTSNPEPSPSMKLLEETECFSFSLSVPTMETMEEIGALIAVLAQPADVLFLDGDIGAGKTTFSRGFIKCKLGIVEDDSDIHGHTQVGGKESGPCRITSPTYLLSNTYEYIEDVDGSDNEQIQKAQKRQIYHMDLYRLSGKSPKDFEPLGLDKAFLNSISLIEWPNRLHAFPTLLPPMDTLLQIDIRIPHPTSHERIMTVTSHMKSSWTSRLHYLVQEGMMDDLLMPSESEEGPAAGGEEN